MNIVETTPAPEATPREPKYFHFSQNNSGGSFHVDDDVAHHVIIQAHTAEEANTRALDVGIYFDGCDDGRDCECCGDRWYRVYGYEKGDDKPMIYAEDPAEYDDCFTREGEPVCHVYHLDGSKTTYRKPTKEKANA